MKRAVFASYGCTKTAILLGGLKFIEEPKVLRFFVGHLAPTKDWTSKLGAKFKKDFGRSL
jgi:tyrosine phenol-lyase